MRSRNFGSWLLSKGWILDNRLFANITTLKALVEKALVKAYTKTKRRLKTKPSQSSENFRTSPQYASVRHAASGSNASDPEMQSLQRLNVSA